MIYIPKRCQVTRSLRNSNAACNQEFSAFRRSLNGSSKKRSSRQAVDHLRFPGAEKCWKPREIHKIMQNPLVDQNFHLYTWFLTLLFGSIGRSFRVDPGKTDNWKKYLRFTPSLHTGKKLKKLYFWAFFAAETFYLHNMCKVLELVYMVLKRFGLESLVCTVLAASWSQHLYYAGAYLRHCVVFACICNIIV